MQSHAATNENNMTAGRDADAMTAPASPIDRAHLARYTLGDIELEREILGLFVGQLPKLIDELKTATSTKAWHHAAHGLKGSARAVGAWGLSEAAAKAEALAEQTDRQARQDAVAAVESHAELVMLYMSKGISRC